MLAEEWEIARFAASLVRVEYEAASRTSPTCTRERDKAFVVDKRRQAARRYGERAYAAAAVRHEAEYFIPTEHHNPMELFAATVLWDGDGKLTVYDKTQGVQNVQRYLCSVFGMNADDVRVMSPFVGGAFGSGLRPQYEVVLAVLAARELKRSVRLVLTRQQMYGLGYRPATIERVALGAKADGTLDAITHEAIAMTSQYEEFSRNDTAGRRCSTSAPTRSTSTSWRGSIVPTPSDMRAPGAATGVYALECAMDELAVALKIDPVELRLRCYSDRDQNAGHSLHQQAAAANATARAPRRSAGTSASPSRARCATAANWSAGAWRPASGKRCRCRCAARIVLTANGHAEVSCAASDIGTGTYTIMAQIAADMLGLPIDNVTIKLGDSTLPQSPVEGGSWTAASVAHAIAVTADEVRKELLRLGAEDAEVAARRRAAGRCRSLRTA